MVNGDPVSMMNFFGVPFIFIFALYNASVVLQCSSFLLCGIYFRRIHSSLRLVLFLLVRQVFSLFGHSLFLVCMPVRSVLSFRSCCNLILMLGICVLGSSLVRCKNCMVGLRKWYQNYILSLFRSVVSRILRVFHSPIALPKRNLLCYGMYFVLGGSVRYITGLGL